MKKIEVKRLNIQQVKAEEIPSLFKTFNVEYHKIDTVDWPEEYPYCPNVEFGIAHKGNAIMIHYRVNEDSVRAEAGEDLGHVWEDSCCEFFVSPDEKEGYYNIETNCIGTVLLCNGKSRENRTPAPTAILQAIDRWTTLGRKPFGIRNEPQTWELAIVVPVESFFKHKLTELSNKSMRANFYKCGDKTKRAHFLSWNPIDIAKPDFHRPDFFGEITFL